MIEEKEANGQIQISDEVISIIAGTAAAETEGVSLPSSAPVTVEENTALIEIEVVVKFGINIKNACEEVQQKVKNAVETMTGLTVSGVNINVTAIMVEKEQPAQVDIEEETEE